jgi:hypothetical protein
MLVGKSMQVWSMELGTGDNEGDFLKAKFCNLKGY